ncbi:MAG: fatty acid desaturase, partial [Gemmatimonadaceae bacterium]|nr:fatty acid desaturase [Gloeobacterales cyanobacterium ES-bin-141]
MANVLNSSSQAQEELDRKLVSDLFQPRPEIFWPDLLASAALGWGAFALACTAELFSATMFASTAVAILALYRALAFVHELSHLRASVLPGFSTAWNFLIGIPLLFPSFVYVGVHAD